MLSSKYRIKYKLFLCVHIATYGASHTGLICTTRTLGWVLLAQLNLAILVNYFQFVKLTWC